MLGIGLSGKLREPYLPIVKKINSIKWTRVELEGIKSEKEFWDTIKTQLSNKQDKKSDVNSKTFVIEHLKNLAHKDQDIVFILNSADEIIENKKVLEHPIYSLYSGTGFIKFLLTFYKELPEDEVSRLLSKLLITDSNHLKMRDKEDMIVLLEKEERWYSYEIPSGSCR